MACLRNFVCTCCNVSLLPIDNHHHPNDHLLDDDTDGVEFRNQMLWSHDLGAHSVGEFSHAVVKANFTVEDHSQIDTAPGALFVGIYDGHGGKSASTFLVDNLFSRFHALVRETHSINETVLRDTFAASEIAFLDVVREQQAEKQNMKSVGSCCLVGMIWRGRLYVANAGDSRVVIGRKCLLGGMYAEQLTRDDNVNRLAVRRELQAANPHDPHIVQYANASWRVKGHIQVSRSIGDAYLKHNEFAFPEGHAKHIRPPLFQPALSAEPNVHTRDLRRNDQFVIFASDGLWDMLSNGRAVEIVKKNPRNGIARRLIREAMKVAAGRGGIGYNTLRHIPSGIRRHFHDDISVVVVFLDAEQERPIPDPVQIRGFVNGVLPGRFDIEGIN